MNLNEIKETLSKRTQGTWEWRKKTWVKGDGKWKDGEFLVGELRQKAEVRKTYTTILDVQKNEHGYPEIYAWVESDAIIIANAPEWLSFLVSKVEEMQKTLGWYADEENYKMKWTSPSDNDMHATVEGDDGERARQALKGIN